MGAKLNEKEIENHTIKNPNIGFDICHVCNGVEGQNEMNSIDPNGMSWDLICDECEDNFKEVVNGKLDEAIDKVFVYAHQFMGTTTGDITPEQLMKLENLKADLSKLIILQTKQNV